MTNLKHLESVFSSLSPIRVRTGLLSISILSNFRVFSPLSPSIQPLYCLSQLTSPLPPLWPQTTLHIEAKVVCNTCNLAMSLHPSHFFLCWVTIWPLQGQVFWGDGKNGRLGAGRAGVGWRSLTSRIQWDEGSTQGVGSTGRGSHKAFGPQGAGHMVPTDKPQAALTMFSRFLNKQPYWRPWGPAPTAESSPCQPHLLEGRSS